jgi:hypothetical protein
MSIVYKPFHAGTTRNPELLAAMKKADKTDIPPPAGEPEDGPAGGVILEQNGIHYINNLMLNPDKDTEKNLDPKFLNLVESVMKPAAPGIR